MIDWLAEVEKRKEQLIKDTQAFLRINSVLDEGSVEENAPFGKGIQEALEFALDISASFGLQTTRFAGYAGHVELGKGDEMLGVLCHVDVVPEGDGWTSPPYAAEIRDGKIFARGAIDDKGPTMAAFYALRIIKELDLELNKRVRVILGTDEESGWKGIKYYFEREKMPDMGFAPDADFPIIITEKGIMTATLKGAVTVNPDDHSKAQILSFTSGKRPNMVPDHAEVHLSGNSEQLARISSEFNQFLSGYSWGGSVENEDNGMSLRLTGVSAHGMEPHKGVNAALELNHFLLSLRDILAIAEWMEWSDRYLYNSHFGEQLGIAFEDDISGKLTINLGIFQANEQEVHITFNIRYPFTSDFDKLCQTIDTKGASANLKVSEINNVKPHHVDKEHFLVKTLARVYEEQTGQEAKLLAIGGGTYARALKTGVAFGPLFPGKEETAHQKDEHIDIEDLIKATAIYAQAIYELAK